IPGTNKVKTPFHIVRYGTLMFRQAIFSKWRCRAAAGNLKVEDGAFGGPGTLACPGATRRQRDRAAVSPIDVLETEPRARNPGVARAALEVAIEMFRRNCLAPAAAYPASPGSR